MAKHIYVQKPGIYKMHNLVTNNFYIGSSKNVSKRIGIHKYNLKNNITDNIRIKKDLEDHGYQSFIFSVIEYCLDDIRLELEQKYYEELKPFYNVWPSIYSAENRSYTLEQLERFKTTKHTIKDKDSFKEKLRIAWKNRRNTPSGKATLEMLDRRGKLHSEETKMFYSKQRKGIPKSEEFKEKLRIKRLGSKWDPINNKWIFKKDNYVI